MNSNLPIIIAHRGASYDAPENTLAAINLAWQQGADAVEVDVRFSSDNMPVVIHDPNTKRTTGIKGQVKSLNSNELQLMDAGNWKGSKWAGEKIPLLSEVLSIVPVDKKLVVEVKSGIKNLHVLADVVKKSLKKSEQIEFISFDLRICNSIKKHLPFHKVMLISEMDYLRLPKVIRPSTNELINKVIKYNLDGLNLWAGNMLDTELCRKCMNKNILLYAWTVNSFDKAKELAEAGVNGITTDKPGYLVESFNNSY